MNRYCRATVIALASVVSVCVVYSVLSAQGGEKFTDFRDRVYSVEDLERALFPAVEPQIRHRGLEPQRPQLPPQTKIAVALNVFFAFNSDRILPKYSTDLDKLGKVLEKHAEEPFHIEGHTDNVGSDAYNQRLSEKRAESVKRYLIQNFAISSGRLVATGYGEGQPRTTNDTEDGRKINRRVEIVRQKP